MDIKLFLIVWLAYALYATPAGGTLPNRYVDLVHSIVNEGRFEIDTYQANTTDSAFFNGHYYNGALPGPSFFALAPYLVFKGFYPLVPAGFGKRLAASNRSRWANRARMAFMEQWITSNSFCHRCS
ncbi:MAG: hypothetical protein M1570_00135 [Chloroflexi bacterium]|nr:hypothetical protein [Chloroflexota bacterium]